jgi:hypothetical protein
MLDVRIEGLSKLTYILRCPFREVCTKFHLSHPWYIPVKFVGELRAFWRAGRLRRGEGIMDNANIPSRRRAPARAGEH